MASVVVRTAPTEGEVQSADGPGEASGTTRRTGTTRRAHPMQPEMEAEQSATRGQHTGRRIKWTQQMNEDIIRCYFRATRGEDTAPGFTDLMYDHWKTTQPEYSHLTRQNILDRRRHIVNKVFSRAQIEQIQREIRAEVEQQNGSEVEHSSEEDVSDAEEFLDAETGSNTEVQVESTENDEVERMDQLLTTNCILYHGMNPIAKPQIPQLPYNAKTKKALRFINECVNRRIDDIQDMKYMQEIVYCAAKTVCDYLDVKTKMNAGGRRPVINKPGWKTRLESRIQMTRQELAVLRNVRDGRYKERGRKVSRVLTHHKLHHEIATSSPRLVETIDRLEQRLAVYNARYSRYTTSERRKNDNFVFKTSEKRFYASLTSTEQSLPRQVDIRQFEKYWADIWEKPVQHKNSDWIQEETRRCEPMDEMEEAEVSGSDIAAITKKLHNWKTPGPDKIQNFWWKNLVMLHEQMAAIFTKLLKNEETLPEDLAEGITYLKPKSNRVDEPSQYRPITCLNTLYKIFTATIATKINKHIEEQKALCEEQKGCRKGMMGCKEQLLIDQVVTNQARRKTRDQAVAWIDYRKAYDSVPHSWLCKVLEIYKVDPKMRMVITKAMENWKTTLIVNTEEGISESRQIRIRRGIFQGDTFSPLWFCLALNPLSYMLNSTDKGYAIKTGGAENSTLTHLLYMDDLKLFAQNEDKLRSLIAVTKEFSDDIQMSFGIDKCAYINVKRGKVVQTEEGENMQMIPHLEEPYKYLGMQQIHTINKSDMKENFRRNYYRRVTLVLRTKLNAYNMVKALNAYCSAVLFYSFGVIPWTKTDLEEIMRRQRALMTQYRYHHPKSAIERLYLPRKEGGRGLVDIKNICYSQVNNMRNYFQQRAQESVLHKIVCEADNGLSGIQLEDEDRIELTTVTMRKESWKRKEMHGRFANDLLKSDKESSIQYLNAVSGLFPETEGFIHAIQDQTIATKNYKKHILKEPIPDDKCRICGQKPETIQHITSACSVIANTRYLHRHNLTCAIIHQAITKRYLSEALKEGPYYEYAPEAVTENERYKLYWDLQISTDRSVEYNKPDITLIDKVEKKAYFIEVSHPADHNLKEVENHKREKYRPLAEDFKRVHHLQKVTIIPVVISVNGLMTKTIREIEELLPMYIIWKCQKSAILETCNIVRHHLNIELTEPVT